jgi:hypothetical protein
MTSKAGSPRIKEQPKAELRGCLFLEVLHPEGIINVKIEAKF